ncbi:MAG TPA: choice-of-anchor V domain-containing protein [Luteibaculaceae bacterium]|nr:choice-of-anchor V domain-containing protein [Luteibaculaceae bacterium]
MKRVAAAFALFAVGWLIYSLDNAPAHGRSTGSPGSYSGSPSDANRTCANGCHGGTAIATPGIITTNIPAEGYVPGQTYTVTVTADYMGRTKYGFELSANTSGGQNTGSFVHTPGQTQAVNTRNATHTSSSNAAPSGSRTWTVSWTAPAEGTGAVTFYAAVLATNSNNSSSGDITLRSSASVGEKLAACTIDDVPVSAAMNQVCEGNAGSIRVTNSQSGVSYQLFNAGTNQSIGSAQAGNGSTLTFNAGNLTTTTTFKIVATKSANCSLELTSKPQIEVLAAPVPSISANGPTSFCEGSSVQLTSSAAQTYQWSNGATTPSITVSTPGSYTVIAGYSNGCFRTSAATAVTVLSKPIPRLTPSGNQTICGGDSLLIQSGAFASYLWSNGATTSSIRAKTAGNYTLRATAANGCSGDSPDTVFLSVTPTTTPTIQRIGSGNPCPGETVTLRSSPAQAYLWSNGATTQEIAVTNSGSFTVTTSNNGCSATSATEVVQFQPNLKPRLNSAGNQTICQGSSINLSIDQTFQSYLWSNGATTPGISVNSSGLYFVQASSAFCTYFSDSLTLTVTPLPAKTVQITGSNQPCPGETVVLTADGLGSYLWNTGQTTKSITVASSGTYQVTISNGNCSVQSDAIAIQFRPNLNPELSLAGSQTVCDNDGFWLKTKAAFNNYLWSNGSTSDSILVASSGDYSVTVSNDGVCQFESDTLRLTLAPIPPSTVIKQGPDEPCPGETVLLTAPAGYSYLWSTGATTASIEVNGSGDFFVDVIAGACVNRSEIINLSFSPALSPRLNSSDSISLCVGEVFQLSTQTPYGQYRWSTGATTASISTSESGVFFVEVSNNNRCFFTSDTAFIDVRPNIKPIIRTDGPAVICNNQPVIIRSTQPFSSYNWSNGSTSPTISISQPGLYSLLATTASGCSGRSDTLEVRFENPISPRLNFSGTLVACDSAVIRTNFPSLSTQWNTGFNGNALVMKSDAAIFATLTSVLGCSYTSDTLQLTVGQTPVISVIRQNALLIASGGNNYQWYLNGQLLPGETNDTLNTSPQDGTYYCTATDQRGLCAAESQSFVINTVGIASNTPTERIELFPNPANQSVWIKNIPAGSRLQMISVTGQIISEKSLNGTAAELNTSLLPNGMYTVIVSGPAAQQRIQLVIQHL